MNKIKIVDVENALLKIKNKIKKEWILAFLSTLIIGLLTHSYIFFNTFPNHDGLYNIYSNQEMIYSGRIFLKYACAISSYYSLNWINGILSLIYISIVSTLITDLFKIKKKINIILISGIVVTFPAIASSFSYMFTADGYMLSLLISTLAVYITTKYEKGYIIGSILLCLSIGIYQAYLSFSITLCILKILIEIIETKNIKKVIKLAFNYCIMGIIGILLYFIILKLFLNIKGIELSNYQGIGNINSFSLINIIEGIKKSYVTFLYYPIKTKLFSGNIFITLSQIFILVIFIYSYIKMYIKTKVYKNNFFNIFTIFLILLIPIGMNIFCLISPNVYYHLLMKYDLVIPYIALIILLDRISYKPLIEWLVTLSLIVIIFNFIIVSNIAYFNLEYKFEKSYSLCTRILLRIENRPEFISNMPLAIIGNLDENKYYGENITQEITKDITGADGYLNLFDQYHYKSFFSNYFGVLINSVDENTIEEIKETRIYKNMESWPSENSMKTIYGIFVIKLG